MTPTWFIPLVLLAQPPQTPLRLATPTSARIEAIQREMANLPRRVRRDPFGEPRRDLSAMEYRAREYKIRAASPAAVCNGNVCAIPVLQQLVP